jgi:hypothetical protein
MTYYDEDDGVGSKVSPAALLPSPVADSGAWRSAK